STSSAFASLTSVSSIVTGPPGIFSRFTIFVWPTRAHSSRIWRTVASLATIDTRPSFIVSRTSADAADAVHNTSASPARNVRMGPSWTPSNALRFVDRSHVAQPDGRGIVVLDLEHLRVFVVDGVRGRRHLADALAVASDADVDQHELARQR